MAKTTDSVRKMVFNFFNQNPEASMDDLRAAFPDANNVSISNYRYQWKKEQAGNVKKQSVKDKVFGYLKKHPTINYTQLRKALPAINPSSVSAYHSQWKKLQGEAPKLDTTTKKVKATPPQKQQKSIEKQTSANPELIKALRATIDAQKGTIEAMKMQNSMLKEKQAASISELEGLNDDQVEEIQKTMATYIKGMRKL